MAVKYAWVDFGQDIHRQLAAENVGDVFEICMEKLGMTPGQTIAVFLNSGLARAVEERSPAVIPGMDSSEQVAWMLGECGMEVDYGQLSCDGYSEDKWTGGHIALVQARTGLRFKQIFDAVKYEEVRALRFGREDWSQDEICSLIEDRVRAGLGSKGYRLSTMRKGCGLTQAQLAELVGISVRTLQQYEQDAKDLGKAAAETVLALARVLGCGVEDLLA